MYYDSNLALQPSIAQTGTNMGTDVLSANIIDLATVFSASVIAGGDVSLGEEAHVVELFQTAFVPASGTVATFQPVLQTSDFVDFSTELITEFPLCAPLQLGVPTTIAALSAGVMTVTTLGIAAVIQSLSRLFTGSISAPVDTGITITKQISGTAGGANSATFAVNNAVSTVTPILFSQIWVGKQVGMRLPTSGLKRYLRMAYRTTGAAANYTLTHQTFIVKDPENQQLGTIGYTVG